MERKHCEELFSPNFSAQDFFSQANQSESLMFEKLALERAKRVKKPLQYSNYKNSRGKKVQKEKTVFPKSLFKHTNLS